MLGSRKFLIFGIVSALVFSLLIVGAFAAEPESVKALGGGDVVKSAPADFQIPSGSPFAPTTYVGTVTGDNTAFGGALVSAYPSSDPVYVTYISVQNQNTSGTWLSAYTASFDSPVAVSFRDNNGWLMMTVDGVETQRGWFTAGRVRAVLQNNVDELSPPSSSFTLYTVPPTFDMGALFASILGIGTQLIAFVVACPIVLIPTVAMILVLSYGVIRRLIKGV